MTISQCRGVEGTGNSQNDLITGFSPVFLKRTNVDGHTSLSTYNLVSSWFWVYDDAKGNQRPVRQIDLEVAYLQNGQYTPEVIKTFDANNDGTPQTTELRIDTPENKPLSRAASARSRLKNPRIVGQVRPYGINHDVVRGETAISACATCHSDNSRVGAAMTLATYLPGGVLPQFVNDTNVKNNGTLDKDSSGALKYTPAAKVTASMSSVTTASSGSTCWARWPSSRCAGGRQRPRDDALPRGQAHAQEQTAHATRLHVRRIRTLLALAANGLDHSAVVHRLDHPSA
ncbi:MAG: hypothetical protein U0559_01245 [Anaerolineae bacterium]